LGIEWIRSVLGKEKELYGDKSYNQWKDAKEVLRKYSSYDVGRIRLKFDL